MDENAEHRAAGRDPADRALAVDPVREVPHPVGPGADPPAGHPGPAGSPGVDPSPGAAGGPAPGTGEGGSFPPGSAAPDQPWADGVAGVRPPAAIGEDAGSVGTRSDGPAPAGVPATPFGPSPGNTAQFPATAGAVPPPQGWYPAGPGTAPYAYGSPSSAPPYPPGPYPPVPSAAPPTEPPRRRTSWAAPAPTRTHRWGLGAYLFAEGVFLLTSALIAVVVVGDAAPTAGALALALSVPTVLAAASALLITWVRGNGPRIDLRLEWSWRDVGLGLAFGFGGLALTIPASFVYVAIVGEDATSAVGDVFGGIRAGPALAALVLVIVVLVAPMCEEILYRGLLWGGIEKLAGRWVAFVVTTLLFALAHFELTRTPLLFVVAIPIAIARLYTGRLLASIVAHQINNLLPGIVLFLGLLGVVPMA
jgi:membrane protease YdiL (CAAX protease family)